MATPATQLATDSPCHLDARVPGDGESANNQNENVQTKNENGNGNGNGNEGGYGSHDDENQQDPRDVYVAQPVDKASSGSPAPGSGVLIATSCKDTILRLRSNQGSLYSYEMAWTGVPQEATAAAAIEPHGGSGLVQPPTSTTVTPSVIEPETWVAFDYPRNGNHDVNLVSPEIDYSEPRLPVFETSQSPDPNRNVPQYFRPARSQFNQYSQQTEEHPYYDAPTATVISGRATTTAPLSITNPGPENVATPTPDELPPPNCWTGFTNYLSQNIFYCFSS